MILKGVHFHIVHMYWRFFGIYTILKYLVAYSFIQKNKLSLPTKRYYISCREHPPAGVYRTSRKSSQIYVYYVYKIRFRNRYVLHNNIILWRIRIIVLGAFREDGTEWGEGGVASRDTITYGESTRHQCLLLPSFHRWPRFAAKSWRREKTSVSLTRFSITKLFPRPSRQKTFLPANHPTCAHTCGWTVYVYIYMYV